ncbi:hypothetical protein [Roseixanthobacter glucoisosaccharinicivorans]|uniref:hypothetical protein n=1 Tax=Roseixanthobacter glucoisosaccharinicivorans TaxID=3119923 RepID=UPI00372765CB
MARSKRRTPIFGNTAAESDKELKRAENRRARRCAKIRLNFGDGDLAPAKAFGSPWNSEKDGKQFWRAAPDEAMRK